MKYYCAVCDCDMVFDSCIDTNKDPDLDLDEQIQSHELGDFHLDHLNK